MPTLLSVAAMPALLFSLVAGLVACASGPVSFDRHNLSRLWAPDGSDSIYFDASVSPSYPRNSQAADASRIEWIEEWLKIRKMCIAGYEILERRNFRPEEDNPYHHDLRYVLRCL